MIYTVKLHSHMSVASLKSDYKWDEQQINDLRMAGRVRGEGDKASVVFAYEAPQMVVSQPEPKAGQDWFDRGDVAGFDFGLTSQQVLDDVKYILDKQMLPPDQLAKAVCNGLRLYYNGKAAGKPTKVGKKAEAEAAAKAKEEARNAKIKTLTPQQFMALQSDPDGFFKAVDKLLATESAK